jgi:flagellar basal-body rod protein FlgC
MALEDIFNTAGSALNAQTTRMNTTASNLANAGTVAGSEEEAFRGKKPLFKALMNEHMTHAGAQFVGGVKVDRIVNDPTPVKKVWEPGNPLADKEGYVFHSNVNEMSEMVDMMAASRAYQNNVEVVNTARQLMSRTLDIIKS